MLTYESSNLFKHSFDQKTWSSENRTLKLWIKFYNELFGLNLGNLGKFQNLNKFRYDSHNFCMPAALELTELFHNLSEITKVNINIIDPNDQVLNDRQSKESYIVYQQHGKNIIESLAFDLFLFYQDKTMILDNRNQHQAFISSEVKKNKAFQLKRQHNHGKGRVVLKRKPIDKINPDNNYSIEELEYWIIQS